MGSPTERTWIIRPPRKGEDDDRGRPVVSVGPTVEEWTSLVEESRLREAEAELKDVRDDFSALQHQDRGIRDLIAAPPGVPTFTAVLNEFNRMAGAEARAERAEQALQEAREALAPFAELADVVDHRGHDDDSTCPHRLKATDVRRARGVLNKDEAGP